MNKIYWIQTVLYNLLLDVDENHPYIPAVIYNRFIIEIIEVIVYRYRRPRLGCVKTETYMSRLLQNPNEVFAKVSNLPFRPGVSRFRDPASQSLQSPVFAQNLPMIFLIWNYSFLVSPTLFFHNFIYDYLTNTSFCFAYLNIKTGVSIIHFHIQRYPDWFRFSEQVVT